MNQTLV